MIIESMLCVLTGWFFIFIGLKSIEEWGMAAGGILILGIVLVAVGANIFAG